MASYADPDYVMVTSLRSRLPTSVDVSVVAGSETPLSRETVVIRAVTGVPVANADPRAAGIWTVSAVVLARSTESAFQLSSTVFDTIVDLERTHVPDAGFISTVDVDVLPTRSNPSEVANSSTTFVQFNMQFTVRLRPHSQEEETNGA